MSRCRRTRTSETTAMLHPSKHEGLPPCNGTSSRAQARQSHRRAETHNSALSAASTKAPAVRGVEKCSKASRHAESHKSATRIEQAEKNALLNVKEAVTQGSLKIPTPELIESCQCDLH